MKILNLFKKFPESSSMKVDNSNPKIMKITIVITTLKEEIIYKIITKTKCKWMKDTTMKKIQHSMNLTNQCN